jgi:hypothetical protein
MESWSTTAHAREQMIERGIAPDQLDAVLAHPATTAPDPKGRAGCRYYKRGGVIAVVNEDDHCVITVGVEGASSRDWRTFAAPLATGPAPVTSEQVEPWRPRQPRVKISSAPVQASSVLDGVHPSIADQVRKTLTELGLDFRSVVVQSPTEVSIVPWRAAS